jgi:hypothetical protein
VSWAKLCDTLHGHPKAAAAGLEAMGIWALALSHCGAYLTDGHITRATALRIAGTPEVLERLAATLVRVGLWESSGDGWQFHDYLAYNPSRAEVHAEREAKRAAGHRGAAKRWGTHDGTTHGTSNGVSHSPASALSSEVPCPRPDPDPVPDPGSRGRGREHERTRTRREQRGAKGESRTEELVSVQDKEIGSAEERAGSNGERGKERREEATSTHRRAQRAADAVLSTVATPLPPEPVVDVAARKHAQFLAIAAECERRGEPVPAPAAEARARSTRSEGP